MKNRIFASQQLAGGISAMLVIVILLGHAACSRQPHEPEINSGTLVAGPIFEGFKSRAMALDEDFVSEVFSMGEVGLHMALSNIERLAGDGRLERDTSDQRRLYAWIEALSTFYWPYIYNRWYCKEVYRTHIEQSLQRVLDSEYPAIHETMMAFLFRKFNIATEPMLRRAAELCDSKDSVVSQLAIYFCTSYFFCPEETPGGDLAKLSRLPSADINDYVTYWRYPPRGYAPPTRDALRTKSAKFIAESKVGKE
jgi:hypothetical protein